MERGLFSIGLIVSRVEISFVREQQLNDGEKAILCGFVQGCSTRAVLGVHISPTLEQQFHHGFLPKLHGVMQRGSPVEHDINVGFVVQKERGDT